MGGARWTPKAAARLGYLAGRGVSLETIMSDDAIAAKSERAMRCVASRWGVPLGPGGGMVAVQPSPSDRDVLALAAGERGVSGAAADHLYHARSARGRLVDAVLDDRE